MKDGSSYPMKIFFGLLRASHFGPTVLVTSLSLFFASRYWWEGPAYVIAIGVFFGQLVVGWSNDLIDYHDDLSHQRLKKPLVAGHITPQILRRFLFIALPIALVINFFGPLGPKAGTLSILAIGCAVAYNFYFKFTLLSWLPYAIAFALLPSVMAISKDKTPHLWMWLGGAMLGVAAHFLNVIKDMKEDHLSGIKGLPQRIGTAKSAFAAAILIVLAIILALVSKASI